MAKLTLTLIGKVTFPLRPEMYLIYRLMSSRLARWNIYLLRIIMNVRTNHINKPFNSSTKIMLITAASFERQQRKLDTLWFGLLSVSSIHSMLSSALVSSTNSNQQPLHYITTNFFLSYPVVHQWLTWSHCLAAVWCWASILGQC